MRSMTGFGEGLCESDLYATKVTLRSVNSKRLDLAVRLPYFAVFLDPEIRKFIADRIFRGKVDVYVSVSIRSQVGLLVRDDSVRAELEYMNSLLVSYSNIQGIVSISDLLHSGVFEIADREALKRCVFTALEDALHRVLETKEEEGLAIEEKILSIVGNILDALANLEEWLPEVYSDIRKRVVQSLAETGFGEVEAKKMASVLTELLVDEELARAKIQAKRIIELVSQPPPHGHKLNILVQELIREVSTLSHKLRHKDTVDIIVNIRSWVEALREHIANVE